MKLLLAVLMLLAGTLPAAAQWLIVPGRASRARLTGSRTSPPRRRVGPMVGRT